MSDGILFQIFDFRFQIEEHFLKRSTQSEI